MLKKALIAIILSLASFWVVWILWGAQEMATRRLQRVATELPSISEQSLSEGQATTEDCYEENHSSCRALTLILPLEEGQDRLETNVALMSFAAQIEAMGIQWYAIPFSKEPIGNSTKLFVKNGHKYQIYCRIESDQHIIRISLVEY